MAILIDAHLHVHKPGNPAGSSIKRPANWGAPVEDLVDDMQRAGVGGAVLVATTPAWENVEYLGECLEKYPGRFVGISRQNPNEQSAHEQDRRAIDLGYIRGVRVGNLGVTSPNLEGWESAELLRLLADSGSVLYLWAPLHEFEAIPQISVEYPELTIVLNLLGYPHPGLTNIATDEFGRPNSPDATIPPSSWEYLKPLADLPRLFVQFGAHFHFSKEPYPYRDMQSYGRSLYELFGQDRLLWMSDWPFCARVPGYGCSTRILDDTLAPLSPSARSAILGGNIRSIFDFPAASSGIDTRT